jgi:hypothetical protein
VSPRGTGVTGEHSHSQHSRAHQKTACLLPQFLSHAPNPLIHPAARSKVILEMQPWGPASQDLGPSGTCPHISVHPSFVMRREGSSRISCDSAHKSVSLGEHRLVCVLCQKIHQEFLVNSHGGNTGASFCRQSSCAGMEHRQVPPVNALVGKFLSRFKYLSFRGGG